MFTRRLLPKVSSSFMYGSCHSYTSVTSKAGRVQRMLKAKVASGLTHDALAEKSGVMYGSCRSYTSVTSKADRVQRVLAAKAESGLTYDALAEKLGVTNTYAAQLLLGQAKLTAHTAVKLQDALPTVTAEDLQDMQDSFPMRGFDDNILKEPNVYRTYGDALR